MTAEPGAPPDRTRALLKLAVMVLGLAAGGWLLRTLGAAPGTDWVDDYVRGQGLWGEAVFLAIGAVATAVGMPRQAIAFLGGYAFGTAIGTLLALVAQLAGCALTYCWAYAVGRAWAERRLAGRFGRRLRRLRDVLADTPFGTTVALRLLPVGSNIALNLLAGMSGIPLLAFLAGSAIGYVPQTLIFALLGDGVAVDRNSQLVVAVALLVVSVAIGLVLLRRHRAGRSYEEG